LKVNEKHLKIFFHLILNPFSLRNEADFRFFKDIFLYFSVTVPPQYPIHNPLSLPSDLWYIWTLVDVFSSKT
jgi:hypothetical protein